MELSFHRSSAFRMRCRFQNEFATRRRSFLLERSQAALSGTWFAFVSDMTIHNPVDPIPLPKESSSWGNHMTLGIGRRLDCGSRERQRLLSDCHRRIEHFLEVVSAVDAGVVGRPLTPERRRAVAGALRQFAVCAARRPLDQHEGHLEHDDEEADEHHARIARLARQWLGDDGLTVDRAAELRHRLARLRMLYVRHLALERDASFITEYRDGG